MPLDTGAALTAEQATLQNAAMEFLAAALQAAPAGQTAEQTIPALVARIAAINNPNYTLAITAISETITATKTLNTAGIETASDSTDVFVFDVTATATDGSGTNVTGVAIPRSALGV